VAAREAEQRALAQLDDAADRDRFRAALELARRGRPYGDETESTVLEALTIVRFVALEAARRLVADGRLAREEDVWFLRLEEVRACLRSPEAQPPDLLPRRREFAWAMVHPAPAHLGPPPAPPPSVDVVPARYRSTVGAIIWSSVASARPAPAGPHTNAGVLRGEAGSPGRATGTVRIVRDMSEFGRVQAGDIVVCPTTAAAWSPIFGAIGGLVTEHGGLLSHPAILAREYGLPAVLGVPEATNRLRDGSRVEIDGVAGTITLV
jgi:pyruvate,water dikinase